MHGAGNDFVLVDDREQTFPVSDREWVARTAKRRTGVGCEGIILIQASDQANFRMRFFNPDGAEVDMCGNGARCVARLAHEIGAAPAKMTIATAVGVLEAEVVGDDVRLMMTAPRDFRMDRLLEIDGSRIRYSFVNTGVPHAVVQTDDVESCDVVRIGAGLRYHEAFAPDGANADFACVTGPHALKVRTYERGVEAETPACGTGVVASALILSRLGLIGPPVTIATAGGYELSVGFRLTEDGAENVTLCGPAEHVFTGNLELTPAAE